MLGAWIGVGLVVTAFVALMGGLRTYRRACSAPPETVRKLLHVGMGMATLPFPWLFSAPWPVIVLAGLFVPGLLALRRSPALQRVLGGAIDGVNRPSHGEIYFPLGICAVFLLSTNDPLLFCVPVLILSLADAAAALIGTRYGLLVYGPPDGRKSVEGSAAFLIAAFLSTHLPLLLFSETGRVESLLIALAVALGATLIEALARRGLDNLLVPLGAFALLRTLLALDAWSSRF